MYKPASAFTDDELLPRPVRRRTMQRARWVCVRRKRDFECLHVWQETVQNILCFDCATRASKQLISLRSGSPPLGTIGFSDLVLSRLRSFADLQEPS